MEKPLISIITITFNAEKELPRTMQSVMEQSYKNYEHIIVDGASTDSTLEIARKNPTARILSEKDKGLYDAMNKGIMLAKGKYLLFLNAGDSFRNHSILEEYAKGAEKDFDIIYGDTMVVDENNNDLHPRHHSAPDILTHQSFSKGMLICHQAFMVKKSIAPQYDLSYRFSADYDWTIKCIEKTDPERCLNLRKVAINYLSDGMTDKNKLKSLRERFDIMSKHYGKINTIKHHFSLIFKHIF